MSSTCDLRALAPAAEGGPVKFPVGPYANAAAYFDAYAEEMSRAARPAPRGATAASTLDVYREAAERKEHRRK
jgi:hypothetical protein